MLCSPSFISILRPKEKFAQILPNICPAISLTISIKYDNRRYK